MAGEKGFHRPVLAYDFRKAPGPHHVHNGGGELHFVQSFQLFHFTAALGCLGISRFFINDFLADFIYIFLMPFFQAVGYLFFQLPFHCLPGQHFRQLIFQFVQNGWYFFLRRHSGIVPAFQNEPFHANEADTGVFIMYIFQRIIPAGLHDDLLGAHNAGINAVNGIDLSFQLFIGKTAAVYVVHETAD